MSQPARASIFCPSCGGLSETTFVAHRHCGSFNRPEQLDRDLLDRAQGFDDAGLTAEALDGLQTTTAQADDAAHVRTETEAAARAARAQLAEPRGRILHELKTLLQAARRARTKDATVPTFRTKLVSPSKPTATEDEDEAATPAPVPTPAPEEPPATKPA